MVVAVGAMVDDILVDCVVVIDVAGISVVGAASAELAVVSINMSSMVVLSLPTVPGPGEVGNTLNTSFDCSVVISSVVDSATK